MEDWHVVGQRVRCIREPRQKLSPLSEEQQPVVGGTYTIREVIDHLGVVGFRLDEIHNRELPHADKAEPSEKVFWSKLFVPVRPTSIESLRELCAPREPVGVL